MISGTSTPGAESTAGNPNAESTAMMHDVVVAIRSSMAKIIGDIGYDIILCDNNLGRAGR